MIQMVSVWAESADRCVSALSAEHFSGQIGKEAAGKMTFGK